MKSDEFCMVMTTYLDENIGKKIINSLLLKNLAACIQVQNIQSYYRWNGVIKCDDEKLLLIKSKKSLYEKIEKEILKLHDYEVPEIVCVSMQMGFEEYFKWIDKECDK